MIEGDTAIVSCGVIKWTMVKTDLIVEKEEKTDLAKRLTWL